MSYRENHSGDGPGVVRSVDGVPEFQDDGRDWSALGSDWSWISRLTLRRRMRRGVLGFTRIFQRGSDSQHPLREELRPPAAFPREAARDFV
jgi:hypothetical protein